VAIIAVLIGAVLGIGSAVVSRGKARDTAALLKTLDLAVQQFHSDAPLAGVRNYKKRFADEYPPDELEAFTEIDDYTPSGNLFATIAPAGADILPDTRPITDDVIAHRDIKAMVLAINLYDAQAADILQRIDPRFRRVQNLGTGGSADVERLDRKTSRSGATDEPLTYYVDSWGTAVDYFSACCPTGSAASDTPPDLPAADARRDASNWFVKVNNGVPLLVSYGPDGPEQFAADVIASEGRSDLVWDYHDNPDHKIDHRLNKDNVYSNPNVTDTLAAGS